MSRQYTEEEVRNRLLDHIWSMIDYWRNERRAPTLDEKLEGLAFSILTTLDGASVDPPKFIVAPDPHSTDRAFYEERGENYYPDNDNTDVVCDLGGTLHDHFYKRRP